MQLIDSCEANLHNLNRQLSNDEQAMLGQIRNYIAQSRSALADNDLDRAHGLALKARLLCDELVKP